MKGPYISIYTRNSPTRRPAKESSQNADSRVTYEEYYENTYEVAYDPIAMGGINDHFGGLPQWALNHLEPYERAIGAMSYRGRMITFRASRVSWEEGISSVRAEILVPGIQRINYDSTFGLVSKIGGDGWVDDKYLKPVIDEVTGKIVWRTSLRYVKSLEDDFTELVGATISVVRSQTVRMMSPFVKMLSANWLVDIGVNVRVNEDGGWQNTTEQYHKIFWTVRAHALNKKASLSHSGTGSYSRADYDQIVDEVKRLLAE